MTKSIFIIRNWWCTYHY